MGRISASARRAATKMRSLFSRERQRRLEQERQDGSLHKYVSLHRNTDSCTNTDCSRSNARSPRGQRTTPHQGEVIGSSSPAGAQAAARPSRRAGQVGFRFLATTNSTSTVSSCSFERTACHERRHRHPASDDDDDDDDDDGHGSPSSAPDASDDQDPRLEERSDTSSLFGTHNPWHASAARGSKAEGKPHKLRLPSFVRKMAAEQREEEEEQPRTFELGEDEEWELHPDEVGPIHFSSHDLFANPANNDFGPRRVDKRRSI
ncbi:uncharacterized protein J3D65DRAFT_600868 [Phyllosticta citribraziliensis]|uniref:Uncharacterized protein n=1 Tax=Phyllosticta citribraziliensis TaxID=989973 RepID=A0ABR1M315_9PEZI